MKIKVLGVAAVISVAAAGAATLTISMTTSHAASSPSDTVHQTGPAPAGQPACYGGCTITLGGAGAISSCSAQNPVNLLYNEPNCASLKADHPGN